MAAKVWTLLSTRCMGGLHAFRRRRSDVRSRPRSAPLLGHYVPPANGNLRGNVYTSCTHPTSHEYRCVLLPSFTAIYDSLLLPKVLPVPGAPAPTTRRRRRADGSLMEWVAFTKRDQLDCRSPRHASRKLTGRAARAL